MKFISTGRSVGPISTYQDNTTTDRVWITCFPVSCVLVPEEVHALNLFFKAAHLAKGEHPVL